ncbi:coiled-coil domain-containing protein 152-like isoform X2 [Anoplopoma fimbria]|uniref:coiled-coil domain-containing protein 152-like isoform X2 n=1 Tax=Anoplopoma fimbria TaxID=229290 RepID=UPI0023EAB7C3|nr:coiled-coil domain-containing protein 152-like isoform X2 [Anoplopoma fimbria]
MMKLNCVDLDRCMEEFTHLEQIAEVNGKNNALEIMLEDANRLMKFYLAKEMSLMEERDSLLITVNKLQQTLEEQCNLRLENEKMKNDMVALKQQNERTAKDGEAELQRLVSEMRAEGERHKRELETVRQQCRREVEDACREGFHQLEAKDAEVKNLLEKKDLDLEESKKRLKDQERERQSELLKLQMEFGAKLARVQSTAQWSQQQQQQQQHGSNLLPQSVFKRKLQFIQGEKNKEIVALRQRIKELEENQRADGFNDSRLKKRRI